MKYFEKKVLSIETTGEFIRGALVVKSGKEFEIRDFVSIKKPAMEDDLPDIEIMREIGVRLGYGEGAAVFVTSMARAVEIPMDKGRVEAMKHHELQEALKWEVEPYTGVTGDNALVGVTKEPSEPVEPGMIIPESDDEEIIVNVSVLERNVYRAIKERFKAAGFKLTRIYPPDVCFYMPVLVRNGKASQAILEIGSDYSNFTVLKGSVPTQISTLNISLEALRELIAGEVETKDLEETLNHTVKQTPPPLPLLISGEGAADQTVVEYIASLSAGGAVPVSIRKTASLRGNAELSENAVYSIVAGSGMRELQSSASRKIGISDQEALVLVIKRSAYLMPLIVTAVLALTLLSHHQYMKYREVYLKRQIAAHKLTLKKKKDNQARYNSIISESRELKDEIEFARKKIAFAQGEADKDIEMIIRIMGDMAAHMPAGMVLSSLRQEDREHYRIIGHARVPGDIGEYAATLQKLGWCEVVKVVHIKQTNTRTFDFEYLFTTKAVNLEDTHET